MFGLLKLVREFIGGKTELGLIIMLVAVGVYVLPIAPDFDWEALMGLLTAFGGMTGVAMASRIEAKEGIIKAIRSLFRR